MTTIEEDAAAGNMNARLTLEARALQVPLPGETVDRQGERLVTFCKEVLNTILQADSRARGLQVALEAAVGGISGAFYRGHRDVKEAREKIAQAAMAWLNRDHGIGAEDWHPFEPEPSENPDRGLFHGLAFPRR